MADLTKDSLYQLIAMNGTPVNRTFLLDAFGTEQSTREQIEDFLFALLKDKKITSEGAKGYRATAPWADIAYVTVGKVMPGKTRVPVQIMNLPDGVDPGATITASTAKKHRLQEGDIIIAGLARGNSGSSDLRARFIARAADDKPYTLTGIFNQKSGVFTPLDKSIKTDFKLAQAPAANDVPHQFLVQLPRHFDVRDPVINVVDDQTRDMITGAAIGKIVTSKHNIVQAHPSDVLDEASILSRRKINFDQRQDLRDLDFVTVDPAGAKDLDDGFYAAVEENGYALYTAIADVPAIVTHGSKVDAEAYQRGLTFYLSPKHTAHMLPESLSTKKSSLIANADRPAIVVKQSLGWDFMPKGYEVFAAVIRSREQLTYGQFYDRLERDDPRFRVIATIHDGRRRRGLNKELDAFLKDNPDRYATKSIVETLMVQTNSLIAQFLKAANVPFLSRNFEQTPAGHPSKNGVAQRAYYASYHVGHAQLGLTHYAHTTSPIRRYADIINLRAVHKALGTEGIGISDAEIANLDQIADHLNARRDVDRHATNDMTKYHAIPDLMRLQAAPVRVGIHEIGADYIDILIVRTGLGQRLAASSLPANQWQIDGKKHELVLLDETGKETRRYKRGDTVLGQLHNVVPSSAHWDITLIPTEPAPRRGSAPKPP